MPTSFGISLIIFLLNRQHPDKLLFEWQTIRRGGYQPPAQHKLKSQEMLGEFAPVSHIYTIQPNTQVRYLAGGW